uniref:Transmembrane protein 136 n=1 Tax=Lygus hesperus TaxID=30085 RepID=A0A0A9XJP4_LYGHE
MGVSTLAALFYVITSTSVLTTLWYSLYIVLKRRYNLEGEYTTRIIAAFHGGLCVVLAAICLANGPNPLYSPGEPNTVMQIITMQISVGYFVYDFVWCVIYQPEPKIMLIHHLASIFAMSYIIILGRSGAEAIGGLCSMEVTNPLLQSRWFLRYYDKKDSFLFWTVEYLFFGLFLSVRLVYGSYLLHAVLMSENTNVIVKLITISLFLISLAFVQNIISIVVFRIRKKNKASPAVASSALLRHESSPDARPPASL